MHENDLALPFPHGHGGVAQPRKLFGKCRQLVVMGREQRAAAVGLVQVFDRGPGDGQAVIGRRATPDFVEDHKRPVIRLVQDRGGFHHLDHEGRPPARKVVGGADAGKHLAHQPDLGAFCGNEASHLGEDRDQRILPQPGGFARHVRTGQQRDRGAVALGVEHAVIGDEGRAGPGKRGFHHRVTPGHDVEPPVVMDRGAAPVALGRAGGQRRLHVEFRERPRGLPDPVILGEDGVTQAAEQRHLDLQRARPGIEDARFQFRQVQRREPHRVGGGLAMDVALRQGRGEHLLRMGGGGLDEIPQHVVVLDLQRLHPGIGDVIRLQLGDHAAPLVPERSGRVEIGVMPGRDEAAIPRLNRRFGDQRGVQHVAQGLVPKAAGSRLSQDIGQVRLRQAVGDRGGLRQTVTKCGQIARSAAVQRQTRQRTFDVGTLTEGRTNIVSNPRVRDEMGDRIVTQRDLVGTGRRPRYTPFQEARAASCDRAVKHVQKAPLPGA